MERQVLLIEERVCPHPQVMISKRSVEQGNEEVPVAWKHVKQCEQWSGQRWQRRLMLHRLRRG